MRANMTLKEWVKMLVFPFSLKELDPHVFIPSAAKNRFVRLAGLFTTLTLGAGVAVTALHLFGLLAMPFLGPWTSAALAIIFAQREDIFGSGRTNRGWFSCGINGIIARADSGTPIAPKLKSLLRWQEKMLQALEDRGGQQMGLFTSVKTRRDSVKAVGVKTLKNKRGIRWADGSLIFYPNMIKSTVKNLMKKIPSDAETLETLGRPAVVGVDGHVRFATGGEIVQAAAHPHTSGVERKMIDAFDANGFLRRTGTSVDVEVIQQSRGGHNGDNDAMTREGPLLAKPFGIAMDLGAMRRFFPAVVHMYYGGSVTRKYLKKTIGALLPSGHPAVNYNAVLKELKKRKYVESRHVSRRFTGVDEAFRERFGNYKDNFFALLESALYGLPVGDSPVIPLQIHFYLTQGNWDASIRYAHVMINHRSDKEALEDILFEDEETFLGDFFRSIFDQDIRFLKRNGFKPVDRVKSLADLWVSDVEANRNPAAGMQYKILQLFLSDLELGMKVEARRDTPAGRIFRAWEERWGDDADVWRRRFVAVAAEQFFTSDRPHAVREFAARSEGTYGIYIRTSVWDDGVTVYSNQQDVAVGINEKTETIAWASDPRVLKTVGPDGQRLERVIHLNDGEVMDLGFKLGGGVKIEAWGPAAASEKGWRAVPSSEMKRRFYPTADTIDGRANPYYAPPPMEYTPRRLMVQKDLDNTMAILEKAVSEWADPYSFNCRSAANLARRLVDIQSCFGKPRLLILGYDNSLEIAESLSLVLKDLVKGIKVQLADTNDFSDNPDKFQVDEKTVALVVTKSGATFPTKLAAKILKKLMPLENIFGMTARTDSVLNTILGQGLLPGEPFKERIFLTGEFYPSEAPVISEVLLLYQQMRLGFELARQFSRAKEGFGLAVSSERLEELVNRIDEQVIDYARQISGKAGENKNKGNWGDYLMKIGTTLGNHARRPFIRDRIMNLVVLAVFLFGGPLTFLAQAFVANLSSMVLLGLHIIDFLIVVYGLPYFISELLSRRWGLPVNGRSGGRKIIIAAPAPIGRMQREFFSRLFANGISGRSPSAIYYQDPNTDLVTEHASDVARGDLLINLIPDHQKYKSQMSLKQVTFPKTGAFFGLGWMKGRAAIIDVNVPVFQTGDAVEDKVIDDTLGMFSMMLAAKAIGVKMAMVASMNGRLWNPAESWSRAGVHTTATPIGVNSHVKDILAGPDYNRRKSHRSAVSRQDLNNPENASPQSDPSRPLPNTPLPSREEVNKEVLRHNLSGFDTITFESEEVTRALEYLNSVN
ncbi:MAG: hypothetical protein PHH57_08025, partial [Candidatus Omnitrophica bacterium]|nr:hypothetical protein [Candidatus Omnitrophota bacterium]